MSASREINENAATESSGDRYNLVEKVFRVSIPVSSQCKRNRRVAIFSPPPPPLKLRNLIAILVDDTNSDFYRDFYREIRV